MSTDADVYYIDHDGIQQEEPITRGRIENLNVKFAVQMSDGTVRAYATAETIGGARTVDYFVHDTGAVRVIWNDEVSEWLAPGTWKLIRDGWSLDALLPKGGW